jgi:FixJ family two-component response regulator
MSPKWNLSPEKRPTHQVSTFPAYWGELMDLMEPVILLALADETLRNACGLLFAEQGYRVVTARGGSECLNKVRWVAPDVLILDEELWAGQEGVQANSQSCNVPWPPVVLLNGKKSNGHGMLQPAPVVACLKRPVEFGDLFDQVEIARKNSQTAGGRAAQGPAMRSGVEVPPRLLNGAHS